MIYVDEPPDFTWMICLLERVYDLLDSVMYMYVYIYDCMAHLYLTHVEAKIKKIEY